MNKTVEQELLSCNIRQLGQILDTVEGDTKELVKKIIKIKKEMRYRDRLKEEEC